MEVLSKSVEQFSALVWSVPLLIALVGTHIFLTFRLRFIQKHIGRAVKLSVSTDDGSVGDISHFGALATALAATIGTGNIIGVSTAIALGGPGAVFWTWFTGILGMATKYGESILSLSFRVKNEKGNYVGGPMYVLERGMNLKWLGIAFAIFTTLATLGTGGAIQSRAISGIVESTFGIPAILSGVVLVVLSAIVIIGGVKKLAKVCEFLVPFMALFYIVGSIIVLVSNHAYLGESILLIVTSAFSPKAAAGGFIGSTIMTAARYGVARGLFSNESGLGTGPIIDSAAQTKNSARQALISMSGVFWDTVVVCVLTGLIIVSSGIKNPEIMAGAASDKLTEIAFTNVPVVGGYMLAVSLAVFAFTTILGWSFLGEKATEYLFGLKGTIYYRIIFLLAVFVGTVEHLELDVLWNFSDAMNGLMVIPNLVALLGMSKLIVDKTKFFLWEHRMDAREEDYTSGHTKGK